MKPLPTEFIGTRDQGPVKNPNLPAYHFKIIKREGMVCLLEKSRGGKGHVDFEVVTLTASPEKRWPDGRVTPAHESMPSPESWGVSSYSPPTREAAEVRFKELVERSKNQVS